MARLSRRFAVLLVAVGVVHLGLVSSEVLSTSPAFFWSNQDASAGIRSPSVAYQTINSDVLTSSLVPEAASSLASVLNHRSATNTQAEKTVLILGPEASTKDVSHSKEGSVFGYLKTLMGSAKSFVSIPNVYNQGFQTLSKTAVYTLKYTAAEQTQFVGACGLLDSETPATVDAISDALAHSSKLVVVCAQSQGQQELTTLLQQTQEVFNKFDKPYVALLVSDLGPQGVLTSKARRRLQEAGSDPATGQDCDTKCAIQVRQLEALILAFVFAIAIAAGIQCMHIVDTPTKFDKPKEQRAIE